MSTRALLTNCTLQVQDVALFPFPFVSIICINTNRGKKINRNIPVKLKILLISEPLDDGLILFVPTILSG